MHRGAYFDPGMEFGNELENFDSLSKEELEKLANILNIEYSEDNIPLERLTDTTQTLVIKNDEDTENDETNEDSKTTLRYRGRGV